MRKALLAAMAACALVAPGTGHASNHLTFTLMAPVTTSPTTAPLEKPTPCASSLLANANQCQKMTWTRLARCAWLNAKDQAQSGTTGQIGYVFKIDATKVRGTSVDDDRDNKAFDLVVTNKLVTNTPGMMDVPDVDVAFYASLGDCVAAVEGPNNTYIPVGGKNPETLISNTVARGSYNGPGDELNSTFPSGAFEKIDGTGLGRVNSYWAIVTIFGGTVPGGTNVSMTCKGTASNPGACLAGWATRLT
jgi:hypothetical protein